MLYCHILYIGVPKRISEIQIYTEQIAIYYSNMKQTIQISTDQRYNIKRTTNITIYYKMC